jgi:hypothetical protein
MENNKITFEIPDHSIELMSSEKTFKELNKKYKAVLKLYNNNEINDDELEDWKLILKKRLEEVLYLVGELSRPVSDLRESLEQRYYSRYKGTPATAERLYNLHFNEIVLPYDTLKNRCYQLMGKMIGVDL